MADFKKDLIVSRNFQKGDEIVGLFIREISGGDVEGSEFQFDVWVNNVEDIKARIVSRDRYSIKDRYFAPLQDMHKDGWKMTNAGVYENPNQEFFTPGAGL
jgi:hypothetical protein